MHFRCLGVQLAIIPLVMAALAPSSSLAREPSERLQPSAPPNERSVKTDRGYMVAYSQRIPGTQAIIEMVPVPGGTVTLEPLPPVQAFENGELDPSKIKSDLGPETKVTVQPHWISKYEITMAQYMPYRKLYYEQRRAELEWPKRDRESKRPAIDDVDAVSGPTEPYDASTHFEWAGKDNSPAVSMTQFAARQHTKWLSLILEDTYRLPLRSEWKHTCLAGAKTRFCFGDDPRQLTKYAVYRNNSENLDAMVVGTKNPNAWGIHDMHGNAAEFVIDDTAQLSSGLVSSRMGHVACGGHMESEAGQCGADSVLRTTERWRDDDPEFPPSCWWFTTYPATQTGFRIVRPLGEMTNEQKKRYWEADSDQLRDDLQYRMQSGRGSIGRVRAAK